ncbi:2'-5' RNA ligase family protein [Echinicola soli]|uniref:2'-5' RNA ligase family protein n=1 Tax=Echinicola soli TaxID=2591634 RepID=A0A514CME8_9BACT|nr:2'-5' RNA ligase family protein [Echinicola soli]QDH80981.1 2'-5' RNA ligase family protein [Echinicola soli]
MKPKSHYQSLFQAARQQLIKDEYEVDQKIGDLSDTRRGITLLARPDLNCKTNIAAFLNKLQLLDPSQYYYPQSDLHITIMSIISCYEGFQLRQINPKEYICVILKSLSETPPFKIHFAGVTLSPAGVLLQGYPDGEALQYLRDRLRQHFKSSSLQQSLDKRYAIQTAHSTIMRYKYPLKNKNKFLQTIESNRHTDFGTFTVNELELVFNDWYQRKENVQLLHRLPLTNHR